MGCVPRRRRAAALLPLAFALAAGACGGRSGGSASAPAPSGYAPVPVPPPDASRILRLRITSAALAGNLLGDSATRNVVVYTPPDYETSGSKRYRTLYLLHGFGSKRNGQNSWVNGYRGFRLGPTMDSLYQAGTVRDLIVIAPDAGNFWGGAFYRDSPVAGGWETFVTRELIGTIDATFRTLAKRESRGLAGHSMGGFGTLSIVARHPSLFGAAYAMSPCCISPDTVPGNLALVWRLITGAASVEAVQGAGFYGGAMMGLATGYTPNPGKPPLFIDSPYRFEGTRLVADSAVAKRWVASAPLRLLDSLSANLKGLRALGFDAGRSDTFRDIPILVPKLDSMLTRKGIPHQTELYDGDHSNRIGTRLPTIVLPFFEKALAR